ncbi:MAG: DUF192 domain-containing protein [Candidatus Paceibacterota bacterium]|jgi:hypothetical protein
MKRFLILFLIIIFVIGIFIGFNSTRHDRTTKNNFSYQTTQIQIGTTTIVAEVADTPVKRELGLSGRLALPADRGMLFVYPEPAIQGFWMKDMHFPIDIIWFDVNKKIIGATKNLRPESYPQVFYSPEPIKYALEINNKIY